VYVVCEKVERKKKLPQCLSLGSRNYKNSRNSKTDIRKVNHLSFKSRNSTLYRLSKSHFLNNHRPERMPCALRLCESLNQNSTGNIQEICLAYRDDRTNCLTIPAENTSFTVKISRMQFLSHMCDNFRNKNAIDWTKH